MAANMFLYWGSGSIPCWKPMIVLEEKGLSGYPNKKISFSDKEHKTEEVLKLNPRGQVPTFKDGDVVVNESGAICFYLEDKFGNQGTKLLPADSADRAKVLQRVFETGSLDAAVIAGIVYYHFRTPKEQRDENVLKERHEAARTELGRWEGYLKATGAFVCGKDFTMADVFFFPYIAFGVRLGLDLGKFPSIKAYYDNVKARPSVKATWPPHWSEGEGDKSIMGPV